PLALWLLARWSRLRIGRRRLRLGRRRWRLDSRFQKPLVQRCPHFVNIYRAFQPLPVDEHSWGRAHANCVGLSHRGLHDVFRLGLDAGLQTSGISPVLLADVQGYVVQLVERVLHVLLISTDGALVGMYVVSKLPIAWSAFLGKAIGVVGRVFRPGMHGQWIVLVDDLNFVAIFRQDFAHQRSVHPGTEGTFEVVVVHDGDFGIWIPAHRTTRYVNFFHGFGVGVLGQIDLG